MKKSLAFLFSILFITGICQTTKSDSLLALLKTTKHDTSKLNILFALIDICEDDNIWPKYNSQAYELAQKLMKSDNEAVVYKGKKGLADAINNMGYLDNMHGNTDEALKKYLESLSMYKTFPSNKENRATTGTIINNIGSVYEDRGDLSSALDFFKQALKLQEDNDEKEGVARTLGHIAGIYRDRGDIPKALEYFEKSLKIREQINDKEGIASGLSQLAAIFVKQGDITIAFEYIFKALKIREEIGDKKGMAASYNNIGYMYEKHGVPGCTPATSPECKKQASEKAMDYYKQSLKLREELNDKRGMAQVLHNIAFVYDNQNNFTEAFDYYSKSLKLSRLIKDKPQMAASLVNIAAMYIEKEKYDIAFSYADSSLTLAKELGYPEFLREAEDKLWIIEKRRGNFEGAFTHYRKYILYRDSITSEKTRKATIKNQLNYEFEKKEAVLKEVQEKERLVAEEKNRFQQMIISAIVFVLLLVMGFAFFIFRTLKLTRKQKVMIEEKQQEILDSIHYARRIQRALITPEKYIGKTLQRLADN